MRKIQHLKNKIGYRHKLNAGFTLIELVIAVGIFAVISLFATGALVVLFESNRKSSSIQSVMTNFNFAFEEMSREIRFGHTYHCGTSGSASSPRNCSNGDTYITFQFDTDDNGSDEQVYYRFNGTELQRKINNGSWQPVTSGDAKINRGRFYVTGALTGDSLQPKVTIVVDGEAGGSDNTNSTFTVQNTLTQRREET